jgi:acyl-CoA synthetase (AMP-forming)/AMP-acid ligase II
MPQQQLETLAITPGELESVLLTHPDVVDAAVFGVKGDVVDCELLRAAVVTRRPGVVEQEIHDFLNERVSPHLRLRGGVEIVDEIARNEFGKMIPRILVEGHQTLLDTDSRSTEFESTSSEGFQPNLLLHDYILSRAKWFGDRPALIDDVGERVYSYTDLIEHVTNCSANLASLGLGPGDRLCLLLFNCIELPVIFLATLKLAAIVVPISALSTKFELSDMIKDCAPKIFVTTADRIGVFDEAVDGLTEAERSNIKLIIVGEHSHGYTTFESLLLKSPTSSSSSSAVEDGELDGRNVISSIFFSSGTTGKSKGCMHNHYTLISDSRAYFRSLYPGKPLDDLNVFPDYEVTVASQSMSHALGVVSYLCLGLSRGWKFVVLPKFDPTEYLRLAHKYKATLMIAVPPLLSDLMMSVSKERVRQCLSSVRTIMTAAVSLSDFLAHKIVDTLPDVQLLQGYGMTELFLTTLCPPGPFKFGSSGRTLDNFVTKIVDEETRRTLGPYEDGELLVKSSFCVFRGYWNNPQATRDSFEDEWFKTGDFGHFDAEGDLFIVDRLKELLKIELGFQVSPTEMEGILMKHPDVVDAAVYGLKDARHGDLPRALIVPRRPLDEEAVEEIHAFVNERVSVYKRLTGGIGLTDKIPRNATGKILRRMLANVKTSPTSNHNF